ncbi:MAG TPA: AsmA family protein, partial [Steroidobacteraceae bacterium]|nr:AsmA family protein [Steroidobacteraceae bacterium]
MEGKQHDPRRRGRISRWAVSRWAIVSAVVLLALGLFIVVFDWNWFKGPVERRISQATGREFRVGDLDVDLGRAIRIRLERPRLANASWSSRQPMAQAERVEIDVAFWPLFKGDVALRSVNLEKPRLLLERDDQGQANWQFQGARRSDQAAVPPRIDRLIVDDGRIEVLEPKLRTQLKLRLQSGKAERPGVPPPLLIEGGGRYRDGDFDLRGRIDSPLELLERDEPYRLDIRVRAGATVAHASGVLRSAVQFRDFDVDFMVAGDDLARLYPLLGLALPETPPFELHGRLTHADGVWRYSEFTGRMGDSDLSGNVSLDINGKRPALSGRVASHRLDFDDLAGMIGAAPQTAAGESASEAQRERAAQRAASPTLLPRDEFNLEKLRSMDADVTVHAASINTRRVPLQSLTARVHLRDGMLSLNPLEIGAAGGTLKGEFSLDASVDPITAT